ncbi:MAG: AIR synthase-related protein [Cruoricaptor ignavus]|nr:AIR synthase-related protein [Cruoricaptor ignavus]
MSGNKISEQKFRDYFSGSFGAKKDSVLTTPKFGVDVSIISINDALAMCSASDPLTYIPGLGAEKSAWLSVHLTANDIATTSVAPQYFQVVLNLPQYMTEEEFQDYWQHIHRFCKEASIAITGGHTAFVPNQNSTISGGGTMFAVAEKHQLMTSEMAMEDDVLIMTKKAAIISVAVLGLQFPNQMKRIFGETKKDYFEELFFQTSVLEEAKIAQQINKENKVISAMHDITEGGVLGAVYEFCTASGLGVELNLDNVPIDDTQIEVCRYFNLSPYEIIGAGSMLMTVKPSFAEKVLEIYERNNISATIIGKMQSPKKGKIAIQNNLKTELKYPEKDPYWEAFANAFEYE